MFVSKNLALGSQIGQYPDIAAKGANFFFFKNHIDVEGEMFY